MSRMNAIERWGCEERETGINNFQRKTFNNNLRRGERAILFCFQLRRDPVRFGAASSGKAAGVAPPAAFLRYKDLHRSLFSYPSFRLSSISTVRPLAPARIIRVYSPYYLLPS